MKAVIYMIICLSFCSELIHCSCLSYGHSCWGAHGKRSSVTLPERTDPDQQQIQKQPQQLDRWALYKIIQDEQLQNNNIFRRIHDNVRLPQDDSIDYVEKAQNNLLNAFKRNLPLVVLDSGEDNIGVPLQQVPKSFSTLNTRKRRSYQSAQNQRGAADEPLSTAPNGVQAPKQDASLTF